MAARLAALALALAGLLAAGCESTYSRTDRLNRERGGARVLLMPMEIQVAQMSAMGLMLPRAVWTIQARKHVKQALVRFFEGRKVSLVDFRPSAAPADARAATQLIKLHEVVGKSILVHQFESRNQLPTKSEKLVWTLGPEARLLRRQARSDYALFVHIRDSYTSAGRVFQIAFLFFRSGFIMPGGALRGFASLVDLRTGDIVWFKRFSSSQGDLRQPETAHEAIQALFQEFPE